jgi:Fe-S-cluster containining protein
MSAVRSLPVLTNESAAICGPCGGKCCKGMPGIFSPEDLGAPNRAAMRERITGMLRTGSYAIDWWDGDPRPGKDYDDADYLSSVEFVRPAVKGHEGVLRHPSWGGACTFLGPTGCAHTFENRPSNCRELVPNPKGPKGSCKMPEGLDKQAYVLMWLPYADLLDEIQDDLRSTHEKETK